jgi:hypothetical protein
MKSGERKYTTLTAKLQRVQARLEEVERELRAIEENWGGSPFRVNIIRYEHDPPMWNIVVQARNRYGYLLEERETLREMARALQRRLKEGRP